MDAPGLQEGRTVLKRRKVKRAKKKLKRKYVEATSEDPAPSTLPTKDMVRPKRKKLKKVKDGVFKMQSVEPQTSSKAEEDEQSAKEVDDDSGASDLIVDNLEQQLDVDIEAFPMEAGDKDGIVNMLTQVFLQADIDLPALADAIIAQSPFGIVIGPAEDQCDEDNENDVYGLLTVIRLTSPKHEMTKYAKGVMDYVEKRAQKYALPNFRSAYDALQTKRTGLFVNERMLNFPTQIISPSFKSLRSDYDNLKKPFQNLIYVHKLRVADSKPAVAVESNGSAQPAKKKRKMGKAEKKRLTQKALSTAEIIYDNVEDELLMQLEEGEACHFDIPVHTEIDGSSKFHTLIRDGKSFKPFRRIVIMDNQRFKAFLDHVSMSF
ncbi:unnamed protein product [Cylicocyclus nassatus]|uniref:Protein BCCIP homolog n=1 Tax=Cylicocyclus nassatus TaxID=53992 RepID=A0AA36HAD3_CYLNA|nr:unnamed protein product [Cylicocyclus nassatus]